MQDGMNVLWHARGRGATLESRAGTPALLTQTYLLMYSPVRTFPQDLHLKQPKCHCLSRASSACPFLMSLPQPAQSGREQQPTVTAISLEKPEEERSPGPTVRPALD